MQKELEAANTARQIASAVCSQGNESAVTLLFVLRIWGQRTWVGDAGRVPLGSVTFRSCSDNLGKILFVTHVRDQTICQLP